MRSFDFVFECSPGDGRGRDDPPAGLLVCEYNGLLDPDKCCLELGEGVVDLTGLEEELKQSGDKSGKERRSTRH